ncbi:DUF6176 family protein [Arthrobacter sp. NicSoilB8]|uniref:DUF6176 family protein n=1 Tax=Arthrobacter sp. NicSoilB8 TaxID=2830998 RepID=UPI001CC72B67|nr:DUF6176 family protein [Arthrobacter sp. NicSoilB8]BCW70024.1 hypothetical protein NicSoilB8_10680 [Arthrobacter sp. NicSoilB8]
MECITWFAPILPGKLEEWKALDAEMAGARADDHKRSRERMGITREVASLMQTPQGDFVCLFHEAEDLAKAFGTLATSDDPYDVWFREQLVKLHGLTSEMLQGPPPAQLTFDYKAG